MANLQCTSISFNKREIPVKVYRERRLNARASISSESVLIRLPVSMIEADAIKQIESFKTWARNCIKNNPKFRYRFSRKDYVNGDLLNVRDRFYHIFLKETHNKNHGFKLEEGKITVKLSKFHQNYYQNDVVKRQISRAVAVDFLPMVKTRVHYLNQNSFRQPLNNVRLKYLTSRWGSCSRDQNINLSTRLLFCPDNVMNYVIIHELAHLLEFNHSPAFWRLVEEAMPDYKDHERWLREKEYLCDF